jgi:hypothetical protein
MSDRLSAFVSRGFCLVYRYDDKGMKLRVVARQKLTFVDA